MNLRSFHEILFLLVILFLSLIGFLGPVFWKIPQLPINNKIFERNFGNVRNIDRLSQFHTNKNYLSSDQFNNKSVVLEWSKLILNNVKIDAPIARMYFPQIPRNIDKYETKKKKSVFIAILLPIALRGNELALEERKLMNIAFSSNNIYKIEQLSKKYKVKNFKKINFSELNRLELIKIKKELSKKLM